MKALASKMQGSAVTNRDLRRAAESIRLWDLNEHENNSEVRSLLLQAAGQIEQRH